MGGAAAAAAAAGCKMPDTAAVVVAGLAGIADTAGYTPFAYLLAPTAVAQAAVAGVVQVDRAACFLLQTLAGSIVRASDMAV